MARSASAAPAGHLGDPRREAPREVRRGPAGVPGGGRLEVGTFARGDAGSSSRLGGSRDPPEQGGFTRGGPRLADLGLIASFPWGIRRGGKEGRTWRAGGRILCGAGTARERETRSAVRSSAEDSSRPGSAGTPERRVRGARRPRETRRHGAAWRERQAQSGGPSHRRGCQGGPRGRSGALHVAAGEAPSRCAEASRGGAVRGGTRAERYSRAGPARDVST